MGTRRRRRRLLCLGFGLRLLCALLGLLPPAALSIKQTHENIELVKITVHPTEMIQISEDAGKLKIHESTKLVDKEATKEEEKTLNSLVGLLQDMVKNIPTEQVSTEPPTIVISETNPSPSEMADTVWVNLSPKTESTQVESLESVSLVHKIVSHTTTPFWKLRNDASASVVLHSEASPVEKTSQENIRIEVSTAPVDLLSESTTSEQPSASVSVTVEEETTKAEVQNFDQLTNGALENLVESLNNVKKLQISLHDVDHKPQEEMEGEKVVVAHKTVSIGIFDLIDRLIDTISGAPTSVKEDPALRRYIEEAENYLKDALELAAEAEKTLEEGQKMEEEKELQEEHQVEVKISSPAEVLKVDVVSSTTTPAPTPEVTLQVVSSAPEPLAKITEETKVEALLPVGDTAVEVVTFTPEPLAEEAEDAQVEMGKLKAFINLLYGFSPHLTAYTKNLPNKEAAEDIINRAMAVLDAIKSIFCGNSTGKSKEMLQLLLKEDMELVRQAMKENRAH